jgi:hypothetical protein
VVIIAPQHSLESAIIHSAFHGLYMDSTHKNQNALRAPLTMLTILNEFHHMVPGTLPDFI